MKNNLIYYVLAIIAIVIIILIPKGGTKTLGSNLSLPLQQAFSTSTTVTVTTSDTMIQATSSARSFAVISNGGPQSVWLNFIGDAATVNKGVLLTASSTYEINLGKGNGYYGVIRGISAGTASSIVTVTGF